MREGYEKGPKGQVLRRGLLILLLLLLFLSVAGNGGLLWGYSNVVRDVQGLQEEIDRQGQVIDQLHAERDVLGRQIDTLEDEKSRLEEEKRRLEEEIVARQGEGDFLERVDRLEADIRAVRRLVPPEAVPRVFVAEGEIRTHLERQFAEGYSEQQAAVDAQVLAILDLLDPRTDLYSLLLDLRVEQVVAFYDLEEGRLYVVEGANLGLAGRLTFVRAYAYALQDQLFDLGAQVEAVSDDSDRLLALQAVAEGDATLVERQYVLAHLDEMSSLRVFTQTFEARTRQLEAAGAAGQGLLFSHEAGLAFALGQYGKWGWAGVDEVWRDPPQSTEQILHPERYPDDAPEVVTMPPLTATLGAGWRFQAEDTLGEFRLRQHLAVHLDTEEVDEAATGWGGDRYALYTQPGGDAVLMVVRLLWDDEDEASEFAEAYQGYGEDRYGQAGEGEEIEGGIWWTGRPGLYLRLRGDEVWLIWAPEEDTAGRVARQLR